MSLTAAAPHEATADLTVEVHGLRNVKGEVQLCVTQRREFLKCDEDPAARTAEMATSDVAPVTFKALPAGTYAVLVLHDENANGKMDKMLGIPKEGFGFSGNPKIRMGPPKAHHVRFELEPGQVEQRVKMKYLL
ncbi:DUF2141 domain-containing protein [Sphingomicrobium clamense]|uniref:DUF2141 domain-containing protein n=1 Tax=Sphingomicrobium clamense TaxID=2851013 RepID=A0ABS6V7T3_9SPHN|nr:DUF2141 domain-containing protein [Sphingomicrobium sp. B8]MBW0145637.1 DUF2141 domain-containing protein [Sphingomicrobium sp. B8]